MFWNDYVNVPTDRKETDNYFYIVSGQKTYEGIKPEKSWLFIDVLFKKRFPASTIYSQLLAIAKEWIVVGEELHVIAFYGDKANRLTWEQFRDTDGKFIWIDYDPEAKTFSRAGQILEGPATP